MKTWQMLGYLGLLPFIITLFYSVNSQWVGEALSHFSLTTPSSVADISLRTLPFLAYSAVILSFLAGSLWRVTLDKNNTQLLLSNGFSLTAFSAIFIPENLGVALLTCAYFLLFIVEKLGLNRYLGSDVSPAERLLLSQYVNTRLHLTLIVTTLHVLAYVLWFL